MLVAKNESKYEKYKESRKRARENYVYRNEEKHKENLRKNCLAYYYRNKEALLLKAKLKRELKKTKQIKK